MINVGCDVMINVGCDVMINVGCDVMINVEHVCTLYASGGRSSVIHSVLRLGIALLEEGNSQIQAQMLSQLNAMDVGFLASVARLISRCSVLDWNAYERYQKSELMHSSTSLG